ncbi:class I SAM-dependent methyltransferase [Calothrix sp. UHCC 0171]|uniref:class I SAM-dependent methyltransferase n=1 Tax=Calothrix sp. UHCC 0171 TaxID=3110245 RepID=UPI002B1E9495|nr:class I SAM-dependent methyltransferase [Calothrix sp. UHCC 0171]MEA5570344.1 class I SAM-dependent methyltransferase [Calothrix sp. UHCC 0171]
MITNNWDTNLYEDKHAFVWKYGEDLLNLLSSQPGENILDLGCGTGQLTAKIAETGAKVLGIDADAAMIAKAKANYLYPNLDLNLDLNFAVADARSFAFQTNFDAVFSNAALHWIPDADAVITCIYQALKPGGRFVAEFGGQGNVKFITDALKEALQEIDFDSQAFPISSLWYFPSVGDYATRLEKQGFDVIYAVLLNRPTKLSDGDAGLQNWLLMFASRFLCMLSPEQQKQVIHTTEQLLKPSLYRDGVWSADYRRIRVLGIK